MEKEDGAQSHTSIIALLLNNMHSLKCCILQVITLHRHFETAAYNGSAQCAHFANITTIKYLEQAVSVFEKVTSNMSVHDTHYKLLLPVQVRLEI